ncbi:hypothetical protein, partial [Streptococcus pseudopneumoniae]|uniref:hypothetical protein n=1 Tax=Streptococcus pseudopneumoniae TaxID=257758 RepID=UPI0018B08B72
PLDTPMPPAFVEALARLSPAQPGALDLDAIEALARKVVSDDADGGYAMWSTLELARDRVPALVARVRELEAEVAAAQPEV